MTQVESQQVQVGDVLEHSLHPIRFIVSADYQSLGDFFSKIVPNQFVDTVASQLFFKLWLSGLTITLPTRKEVDDWQGRVFDTGYGQLVMDCIIHYRGDSDESPNRLYGGAVLTYTRVTDSSPHAYDCQLSFHT